MGLGFALHAPELHASLRTQTSTRHVDSFDGIHGFERQHEIVCGGVRAIHEAGEAAVRNDRLTARMTQPEHGGDLLGTAWPHQ
jgi:hypothetical protein